MLGAWPAEPSPFALLPARPAVAVVALGSRVAQGATDLVAAGHDVHDGDAPTPPLASVDDDDHHDRGRRERRRREAGGDRRRLAGGRWPRTS